MESQQNPSLADRDIETVWSSSTADRPGFLEAKDPDGGVVDPQDTSDVDGTDETGAEDQADGRDRADSQDQADTTDLTDSADQADTADQTDSTDSADQADMDGRDS